MNLYTYSVWYSSDINHVAATYEHVKISYLALMSSWALALIYRHDKKKKKKNCLSHANITPPSKKIDFLYLSVKVLMSNIIGTVMSFVVLSNGWNTNEPRSFLRDRQRSEEMITINILKLHVKGNFDLMLLTLSLFFIFMICLVTTHVVQ